MYPINADLENGEFKFKQTPHGAPKDYYEPPLTSSSGSNYFNNEENTLYVVVRGSEPVDIHTTPVIEVSTDRNFYNSPLCKTLIKLVTY